ncbi:MAG TPA: hypothetical protein VFP50_10135 [Anaeromyxobacteraceae bacterium]|nr:hypothetical protein [Anaeromyxobacteraceae bacterium]
MNAARTAALAPLLALAIGCGGPGGGEPPAAAGSPPTSPGSPGNPPAPPTGSGQTPGTPAPAPVDPAAPPPGGSGSSRFQIGAAAGLYLVDPVAGEPSVEGLVVVTLTAISTNGFIPPADTVVTLNGVPLLRDPSLSGAYWRVDPAGPQPVVGSGGELLLVARATLDGKPIERTLVLPCPADVAVTTTPAPGAPLAQGGTLHLASAADLTLNPGVPAMANTYPTATLYGFDPAARTLSAALPAHPIGPGPLAVDLTAPASAAPAWLLDLRWPGPWVIDGETGGFCGLAKRFTWTR